MRKYFMVVIGLFAWVLMVMPSPSLAQSASTMRIGTNLASVVSWGTQIPFVDVFKTARPWISNCEGCDWDTGGALDLTEDGWITSLEPGHFADTIMMDATWAYPEGEYVFLYEGEGFFQFMFGGEGVEIIEESEGRMVLNITATEGFWIRIFETNPDNPLRNFRLILPGFEETYETQPFNPAFLERLEPFDTLRFMDWMNTNHTTITGWDQRTTLTSAVQTLDGGVAVEYMVMLANTLSANPWFTMPHTVDNDYIRQFATYVRDNLNPDLQVYIEYSNETWNGQFPQAQYVLDQGTALGLSTDTFQAGLFYHSQRAVEIFTIWEEIFGGTDRLVRVLASQAGNAWTGEQVAIFENAFEYADALAIAPYFGGYLGAPETADAVSAMSLDELFAGLSTHIDTEIRGWIADNVAVASTYGLELVAYEGGQHLAGFWGAENNDALTETLISANRDPRMYDLYMQYLGIWQAEGGDLFTSFSFVEEPSKWGSWGVLEYQTQPIEEAPKYRALLDFIALLNG